MGRGREGWPAHHVGLADVLVAVAVLDLERRAGPEERNHFFL